MNSKVFGYLSGTSFGRGPKLWTVSLRSFILVMFCLVLLCTFIQIGSAQPSIVDDDDMQTQLENPFIDNYANGINDRVYGKVPLEDYFYHKKQLNPDNVQLAKRIIMLPRVGRRSVRST